MTKFETLFVLLLPRYDGAVCCIVGRHDDELSKEIAEQPRQTKKKKSDDDNDQDNIRRHYSTMTLTIALSSS
jgi:hypothetical protein